jgi:hypothetical protein
LKGEHGFAAQPFKNSLCALGVGDGAGLLTYWCQFKEL